MKINKKKIFFPNLITFQNKLSWIVFVIIFSYVICLGSLILTGFITSSYKINSLQHFLMFYYENIDKKIFSYTPVFFIIYDISYIMPIFLVFVFCFLFKKALIKKDKNFLRIFNNFFFSINIAYLVAIIFFVLFPFSIETIHEVAKIKEQDNKLNWFFKFWLFGRGGPNTLFPSMHTASIVFLFVLFFKIRNNGKLERFFFYLTFFLVFCIPISTLFTLQHVSFDVFFGYLYAFAFVIFFEKKVFYYFYEKK